MRTIIINNLSGTCDECAAALVQSHMKLSEGNGLYTTLHEALKQKYRLDLRVEKVEESENKSTVIYTVTDRMPGIGRDDR